MKRQIIIHSPAKFFRWVALLLTCALTLSGCLSDKVKNETVKNKDIVRKAFEKWANAEGSFFDLLAEDVVWTITGNSPVSKKYTSKKQFIEEVIDPLNEKFSRKIMPSLRGLYADGDMVIALWHGKAVVKDGLPYDNTYSWYMKMKDGKIIEVIAFFDTIEFTKLWNRISAPVSQMGQTKIDRNSQQK